MNPVHRLSLPPYPPELHIQYRILLPVAVVEVPPFGLEDGEALFVHGGDEQVAEALGPLRGLYPARCSIHLLLRQKVEPKGAHDQSSIGSPAPAGRALGAATCLLYTSRCV